MRCVTIVLSVVALFLALQPFCAVAEEQSTGKQTVKVIAIGDVDAGYNISGQHAYDVKETIQLGLKKEIEKRGKGTLTVNIVSPAVRAEGAKMSEPEDLPQMPTDRAPTQKEMAQYIAAMQQWQKEMTGQVKKHKPVEADAYFEFKVQSQASETTNYGTASTIGDITGHSMPSTDFGVKSTKVYLIATQRDPKTGALIDKHTAKASSLKVRNIAGYTSYYYGSDEITNEQLFKTAIEACAKWIVKQMKSD